MGKSGSLPVIVMVLTLVIGQAVSAQAPIPQNPQTVKIAFRYNYVGFPLTAADKLGFFAKEGIKPEFLVLNNKAAYVSLLKGDVDVVTIVSASTINLYLSGAPLKVIMKLGDADRTVLVSNWGAKSVRDLVGKTVGVTRPTDNFTYFVFQDKVNEAGLDGKVNIQLFDRSTAMFDALRAGKLDALVTGVTGAVDLRGQGFGYELLSATRTPARVGLVVTDRFLANPDLARRLIRATRAATQWIKSHPDETTKMMGDYFSDVVYQRDMRPVMQEIYRNVRDQLSVTGAWSDADILLLADYLRRPIQPPALDPAFNDDFLVARLRQLFTNDYLK